ncbi:Uncharacterized protein TCM_018237 [Theobroma cacao]|uniref:Uncharacterized protein n=1 Tax=Theobroma cacao TaxID=3641 RepID=A0A061ELZ1_THECC|nr:Uncharacterized protein TCM_018237 [Theobroma cacao]
MGNINQENGETEGDIVETQIEEQNEHSHKDWVIDAKQFIINNAGRPLSRRCCIYRAHILRDVDKAAFTPQIVSIGPLHHFEEHLMGMEETKVKFLEQFLQRVAKTARLHEHPELTSLEDRLAFVNPDEVEIERAHDFPCLGNFLNILKSLENDIRSSYAENLNHIVSEVFLRLILVDAAFIIELFLRYNFRSIVRTCLPTVYFFAIIRSDLWLLENQLPFFVLRQLYDLAFGSCSYIYPPFLQLTCKFFELYNEQKKSITGEVNHFTDLLRYIKLEEKEQTCDEDEFDFSYKVLREHLPSATQLHAAGVKFRASESKCLFDIKFCDGILEIPSLHIWEETAYRFRNLIALEQYHYPHEQFISDYFTIMDYLLDTSKDIDLLVEKKIIKHWLGSSGKVANLFNSLCTNILKGRINRRFFRLIVKLNKYHNQPWHSWKATLYRQYFSTPWRSASTVAATIFLVLTLTQTIMTGFTL